MYNVYIKFKINNNVCIRYQILMATSEDDLQTMAHRLHPIARKYKMTLCSTKQNQWQCGGSTYRG